MPEGFMCEPAGHAVTHDTLLTAAPAPRIGVNHTTLDHRPTTGQVLTHRDETKLIQAAKRSQIGCSKGSVRHVEVFRTDCVRTSILEDLDTPPQPSTPTATTLSTVKSLFCGDWRKV